MTRREPPRLALALLERLVPDSACLAGDLAEEYHRRPSRWWLWWEVLAAIAAASKRPDEIRPLRLVDFQPEDAVERTRRIALRFASVNLTASPLQGTGGLAIAALALLMTLVLPAAWWLLLGSMLAGVVLGVAMIATHRSRRG